MLKICPKWQNFTKSGHTGTEQTNKNCRSSGLFARKITQSVLYQSSVASLIKMKNCIAVIG